MKIIFLGTNGWFDSKTGNTISTLIETPQAHIVLEAGNGLAKLDQYAREDKPVYIFLSHFHLDHVEGLHTLAKFRYRQGITIIVPKGKRPVLNRFMNWPYTIPPKALKVRVKIREIGKKGLKIPGAQVITLPLKHINGANGYRFLINGKIIAYAADTGYCQGAVDLGQQADWFITECAMKAGGGSDDWPHLNPQTAARLALAAQAKKLILTHFDAVAYPTSKES